MTSAPDYMELALAQARFARGTTSPNPAVGAVIVRDGAIVGRGHTRPPGGPHAEVVALAEAGERARGAVMYVTLEPCNMWGRTGPCTRAVIDAGITELHCAMIDPDERVRGGGVRELEAAGVRAVVGEREVEARRHLEDFIAHRTLGRPLVVVKFAASLDGRIAAVSGDARWVSSPAARAWVHQQRALLDAIMVGSGTVLADDPLLTARADVAGEGGAKHALPLPLAVTHEAGAPLIPRQPLRVVVDSRGRTPAVAKVLNGDARTLVATTATASTAWRADVVARGSEVAVLPAGEDGRVNLAALLQELGRRGVMSVLVEGGGTLLGALFDAGLVDKVHAVVAPLIIGGMAVSAVGGAGAWRMADARRLTDVTVERLGDDVLVTGYVQR